MELISAFKELDEHYGRGDMVIRESLRNLKKIVPVKNIADIRANRNILSIINTNISTLKCYNFDLEGNEVENSTFLIEIEEKVPHKIYIKWEQEKASMKRLGQQVTIQRFLDLYTEYLNIEENAQYLRRPGRNEEKGNNQKPYKAQLFQTTYKVNKKPNQTTKPGIWKKKPPNTFGNWKKNQYNKGNQKGFNRNKEKETGQKRTPFQTKPWPKYCIFCETNTHLTGYCTMKKYTTTYKEDKCRKHNACYMCFQTTEHRAETCPKRLKCLICPRVHHFNMHEREKVEEYYKKKKQKSGKQ